MLLMINTFEISDFILIVPIHRNADKSELSATWKEHEQYSCTTVLNCILLYCIPPYYRIFSLIHLLRRALLFTQQSVDVCAEWHLKFGPKISIWCCHLKSIKPSSIFISEWNHTPPPILNPRAASDKHTDGTYARVCVCVIVIVSQVFLRHFFKIDGKAFVFILPTKFSQHRHLLWGHWIVLCT